jgi:polynucleotide 5'-hydroxyl-kinase GRC3/NOL9
MPMEKVFPSDWAHVTDEILKKPGIVIFLGEVDTGKTTLCLRLAHMAIERGYRVTAMDLDVGQSHIGSPATIGLARVESSKRDFGDVKPMSLYFIGALSPGEEPLKMIQGIDKLLQVYRYSASTSDLLLVDTSGYVHEPQALSLKWKKISLIRPDYLIFSERENELAGLIRLTEKEKGKKFCLGVPDAIQKKSADVRRSYRLDVWRKTFRNGSILTFPRKFLVSPLVEADLTLKQVQDAPTKDENVEGSLVGLLGPGDHCLGIGIVEGMSQNKISVYTSLAGIQGVEKIVVGRTKEPWVALRDAEEIERG